MMRKILQVAFLACLSPAAWSQDAAVEYLANEGVMIWRGDTKILFDPLYDNSYGTYQMVPDRVRNAIFAGEAPYDGVQAVVTSGELRDDVGA